MVDLGHILLLLIVLMLVCVFIVKHDRFQNGAPEQQLCVPVTPLVYDRIKDMETKGQIPFCVTADPLGADDHSMKLEPVHCQVSEWVPESQCFADCGQTGYQNWKRNIIKKSENGGTACPLQLSEKRECKNTKC